MKIISCLLLTSSLFFTFSCGKNLSEKKITETPAKADYLPGPCPYDCHDTRCQAYLNGYCGGVVPPDSSLTKVQFIAVIGGYHNAALTNAFNSVDFTQTSGSVLANSFMTAETNFFYNNESHLSLPAGEKTYIVNYLTTILNSHTYYGAKDGHALDSVIISSVNQIAPTLTTAESNLLHSALNIYNFNATNMTSDSMYNTILSRANTVLSQYNQTTWTTSNGDCIGGYLQIVINSAQYWKYVNDNNGNPPPGGGNSIVVSPDGVTKPYFSVLNWFRGLAVPELDAAGYIIAWGKAWLVDDVPTPNGRIKAGLWGAGALSTGGFK